MSKVYLASWCLLLPLLMLLPHAKHISDLQVRLLCLRPHLQTGAAARLRCIRILNVCKATARMALQPSSSCTAMHRERGNAFLSMGVLELHGRTVIGGYDSHRHTDGAEAV